MPVKRKDNQNSPVKIKKAKHAKAGDFSDDEDLSDIEEGEIFNGIRIPAELPPIKSAEENSGPRMIITHIVANNFKSYFGEVHIGPFHKSLTSIVGANGSGKSNVIDSLLFVFGYRSTKIRSKKVSVLIHKSDKHKDVRQCSVTVHFVHINDDDIKNTGYTPIPGTELAITRTAFTDNSSFYNLNNKRVKFKDVATVLKKNGIDLIHNRFLILQGEVEQIAMMKAKAENENSTGMLEYLEDVIGTTRYKKPIFKLEEKINEIAEEKKEKITRLKFVAKEREELLEPAESTIRYLKLRNQSACLQNQQFQIERRDLNKKIDTVTENQNKLKDTLNTIEDEIKAIAESKKDKEMMLKSLSNKLKADISKKDKINKKLKNVLEGECKIKMDSIHINEQIQKNKNSILLEEKKITKAKGVPKIKEAELERLRSQLEPLEEECTKLEANYTKITSNGFEKSKKFREDKDNLVPEELKLQKLLGGKQNQFQTLKTEFEVLLDTEKSEREKLSKLENQLTNGTNEFEENMKKKVKAEADILNSRNTIKELEKNIEKLKNNEQQMTINLQNIRQSLTEKRTAYAETTERSKPTEFILKLKDSRKIRGVLGRCGDYGQVEDKYDVPASTACGSAEHIVVESSDAAHACIQKLREGNVGRLTFSILPQLLKLQSRADANNDFPENAKRVFDLIQILDQRFRLTFYSGLYDTLLAENLEQARRIAFGTHTRYRVVTYKGDVIDQSGLMSGGGRPIKGKIGPRETRTRHAGGNTSLVSKSEVEKLDKISKDLEIKLRETQSNIYDFEADIEKHRRQIEELNIIVRQCSLRINTWKEKENQIKNLIDTQKLVIIQKKTDPIAVANKEAEIKKAEKELEEATKEYNKIKSKVDNLTKKIEEITEGEPKEAKRLLDEATNMLEKTHSGINQANVDIKAAERLIKKSEGQIKSLQLDINEREKKIECINDEIKSHEVLIAQMQEEISKLTAITTEQQKNIDGITNKEDENFIRSNELRKEKIKLSQNLDNIKDELETLLDQRKHKISLLAKLKLNEIPEIGSALPNPIMESYQNECDSVNQKTNTDKNIESNENKNISDIDIIQEKAKQNPEKIKEDFIDDVNKNNETVLVQYTDEELDKMVITTIIHRERLLNEELNSLKPDFKILEELKKRTKQYNEKANELAVVLKIYNDHVYMANKIRQRRKDEFMASFKKITIKLKEMYQMITLGGDAELELVDSLDPFSEGVNFSVRPPKKTWKVISNLSGGEKTLSSLALVFALHYYKPSPLYVMDEIDAALDFKNVSIIAHYIKERTQNSQFIIISLRSNMFERANLLVGIFKTNDCTKTVSIKTNNYVNLVPGTLAKISQKT